MILPLLDTGRGIRPVIAENLIRAENTAVTPIDEIIKCQDESRFHGTVHTLCLPVSNPYGPPGRDCGSSPPDRRASTQRAEASAPQASWPVPVDSVVLGMAGAAALAPHPEARHSRPLASECVRSLLDVEVAAKARATASHDGRVQK